MDREEKLKIFAVLAVHKDIPQDLIKNKIGLLLMATYGQAEALIVAGKALQQMGLDPNQHVIPQMIVERNAEDMIQIPIPVPDAIAPTQISLDKSKEQMAAYARYVFEKGGSSPEDASLAERIISNFMKAKIRKTIEKNQEI